MRKLLQLHLTKILVLVFMATGIVSWGQYSGTGTFTKVAASGDITDGYYVLANATSYAMNNSYVSSTYLDRTSISPTGTGGTTITNPSAAIVWRLETNGGGRTIYNEASAKYVSYAGSSNNVQVVDNVTQNNQRWTITFVSNGVCQVRNLAVTDRYLQYNSGSPRFACYTGSQTHLTLYKMPFTPVLAVDPATITNFGTVSIGASSSSATFQLTGSYLTANAIVNAPAGFELSTNGTTWLSQLSLAPTSGSVSQTVSVRFTPVSGGPVSGNITVNSTGAAQKTVAVSGTGESAGPYFQVQNAANTSFGNVCTGQTGATTGSFELFGYNLTSADVTIGPLTGYTLSLSSGGTYTSSLIITPDGGNIAETVYIRFSPSSVTSYNGNINITGGGVASTVTVPVTGAGINTVPTVTTPSHTAVLTNSATAGGNITGLGCTDVVERGIYYSTTSGFANGSGIKVSVESGPYTTGAFTVQVNGLAPATTYYYKAFARNSGGTVYTAENSFTTACDVLSVPYTQNFNAATFPPTCWAVFRGTNNLGTQYDWTRTTTSTYEGAGAAFVRYENVSGGLAEDWLVTPALAIPDTGNPVALKFVESISAPSASTEFTIRVSTTSQTSHAAFSTLQTYNGANLVTTYTLREVNLSAYAGQTIYIAFVSRQDNGESWYIDNVNITEKPNTPVATDASGITTQGFTANWNDVSGADSYRLDVSKDEVFNAEVIGEEFNGFNNVSVHVSNSLNSYMEQQGWTGTNVYTEVGFARIGVSAGSGQITTPTIDLSGNNGNATVSIRLQQYSDDEATVQVMHAANGSNFSQIGSNVVYTEDSPAGWSTHTFQVTGGTAASKIRIQAVSGGNRRFYLDDVVVSYSNILQDYNNITVNGTSYEVTGLQPGTSYHYRVRAYGFDEISGNSNPIEVTTGIQNVWDGNVWTGGEAPTVIDEAIIEGDYNTGGTEGTFTAGSLILNEGIFTVSEGTTLTVTGPIVNNVTAENFIVENNANLIQVNDVNNEGEVTVYRNSASLYRNDYTMWSSPVTGLTLDDFSPDTTPGRYYILNTDTNQFNAYDPLNPFAEGRGYLIRVEQDHPLYEEGQAGQNWSGSFAGEPNNGNVTLTLSGGGSRYNMVGNPYPSPIRVEDLTGEGGEAGFFNTQNLAVLEGTVWMWRKRNATEGSAYVTMNAAGEYAANGQPGGTTGDDPEGIIRTGQGFLVRLLSTAGSTANITFSNTMRSNNAGDNFFRMNGANNGLNGDRHALWLDLTNEAGFFSQMTTGYYEGATTGVDNGIDSRFFGDSDTVLAVMLDTRKYIINGHGLPFEATDVVPLYFETAAAGNYTITLSRVKGLFEGDQDIYLKDKMLNVTHDLKEGSYTFTTDTGAFPDRFEVVYTTDSLGTDNPAANTNVVVYKQGNALHITSGNVDMAGVTIHDIRGRLLYSATDINASQTVVSGLQAAQQVLIVQVTTANGSKVTKKVVY